jgi:apolipoprotein N-acyltransferase
MWRLLFAGGILPLAFAPLHYTPLVFIGLFFLFNTWLKTPPKHAFIAGWCFGLGFFGTGVSWVFISIHQYGYTNIPLACLITALFIMFLAIFPAAQGFAIKYLYQQNPKTCLFIAFPASWVLMEWIRGWLFTGFPWLYLGYSQLNTPLAGFAPIIGVYGISFLVVLSTSLIISMHRQRALKFIEITLLITIWLTGFILQKISWTMIDTSPHTISLVQGNLAPDDKFLLANPIQTAIDSYLIPSQKYLDNQFIIWPENSLTLHMPAATPFITAIDKLAKQHNVSLILGLPVATDEDPNTYYNTLLALGTAKGSYHKKILVPFGEYLPLEQWLRGLINFFDIPMSNFKPDVTAQPTLNIPHSTLLPSICYEIAYPELIRKGVFEQQSEAILTISEDGWFGNSWGPHQNLDIARMRALENGKYVIRSTTSGISALINEQGQIIQQSPQFKPYVLTGKFFNGKGNTPWTNYGQLPILLFCCLLLAPAVIKKLFRRSFSNNHGK